MNKTIKVKQIEDNTLFDIEEINQKLKPSMVISVLNPLISISFIKSCVKDTKEQVLKNLASKANINYADINESSLISNVVNDLCVTSEKALQRSDESGIVIADLVKKIIEEKVILSLQKEEVIPTLSIEDLTRKLYSSEESKGRAK